jgi:hypothetical protein
LLSKEHIQILKNALFKAEVMNIPQYILRGISLTAIKIDLEYEYCILEGCVSLIRNGYYVYHETIARFKQDYCGD